MEHLRPHPSNVPPHANLKIKNIFASRTPAYHYAFNNNGYTDFDVYNILGTATVDRSNVGLALRTSTKPVVFFLCYDVGQDKKLDMFIRHVVCCVAFGPTVYFLDMRDLADISPSHKKYIEKELERKSGVSGIQLVNAACFTGQCVYLQRFKDKQEVGWCIAWALYFLDSITGRYKLAHARDKKKYLSNLYRNINTILSASETNLPIEMWYSATLQNA